MTILLTWLALLLTPSALILLWMAADSWLARREDDKRRAEQGQLVDTEWLAVLAATETTPIFAEALGREPAPRPGGRAVIALAADRLSDLIEARPELEPISLAAQVRAALRSNAQ